MSYEKAMELAGAKVIEYKAFGSYQGDWWALVEYKDKKGWVNGSTAHALGVMLLKESLGLFHTSIRVTIIIILFMKKVVF